MSLSERLKEVANDVPRIPSWDVERIVSVLQAVEAFQAAEQEFQTALREFCAPGPDDEHETVSARYCAAYSVRQAAKARLLEVNLG